MTKQSNFDDVLFGLPERADQTWLVQKTLRSMKVATPSFDWFPLSSTLGHGVGVLASGQLPYLGYTQIVVIGIVVLEIDIFSSSTGEFNIITLDHILHSGATFLNSVEQSNSEDVSLSMPGRTCQDVSVVICD